MWVVDWKKLQMQACRLRSHTVDVTPPQAATKIMAGMAEQQTEWRNWMADGMVKWREWREWRNGRKNGRMAKWQKWLHRYYLWYTLTTPTTTTTTTPFNLLYYWWPRSSIALKLLTTSVDSNPEQLLFQANCWKYLCNSQRLLNSLGKPRLLL